MIDQDSQNLSPVCHDIPLVAREVACTWPAVVKWSPDFLEKSIQGALTFRMGRKHAYESHSQWESDANYVSANVTDFLSWCNGNNSLSFKKFPWKDWWAYAAYLHMSNDPYLSALQKDVPWDSIFPILPNSNGSTFWLGTKQSHTGCHYDTYGINFVLQVFGKKRWTLFPPTDSPFLYPTRIPLEESTVFSHINFQCPNFLKYPLLLNSHPRVVVLQPGDILFVPRHWWHFVETVDEDISCAVNLWIDQPHLDNVVRCKEALTQLACFSLVKGAPETDAIFNRLHSAERAFAMSDNWFDYLVECISSNASSTSKRLKLHSSFSHFSGVSTLNWNALHSVDIVDILPDSNKLSLSSERPVVDLEKIIAAFLHPDVIDLVYSKIIE